MDFLAFVVGFILGMVFYRVFFEDDDNLCGSA